MSDTTNRDPTYDDDDFVNEVVLGTDADVEKFLREYGPLVFRIIRRRLLARSPRFDSADIAQAVWASFFGHRDKLGKFATSDDMVRYLAAMALNKVRKVNRDNYFTQKRAVSREMPQPDDKCDRVDIPHMIGPTPSQVAIADETWERMLADLSLRHQQILHMKLEGRTQEEIAQSLGVSVRTVARLMSRIVQRVQA